jgi:hypothetical protein
MGLLAGCASPMPAPLDASPPDFTLAPAATSRADGLTEVEAATLASLEQVDGYPLYTMRFVGPTEPRAMGEAAPLVSQGDLSLPAWGCSLFAALADRENSLYGRNFDWEYSPALLLFTDPPDGYASVSLVDIAYLGFAGAKAGKIVDLPLAERRGLLNAPAIPFDGLNERGLAVGMAAVPPGNVPDDPEKETIGSLGVIRKILDWAQNVDEAVQILASYNIDFGGGPPIHYLIADRSGRAVLVEFYQGEIQVLPNDQPWHQATNFLRSAVGDSTAGQCWRYDKIGEALGGAGGRLDVAGAVGLLESVAQDNTQWSVVYGIASGEVHVVVGQKYEEVHSFKLVPGSD